MCARLVSALLGVCLLCLGIPAFAQDDSALVQKRIEVREMVHESLAALFEASLRRGW